MAGNEFLDAALSYAERGWLVFPCREADKRPHPRLAPKGFHNATTDVDQVTRWWREIPRANIGIATGTASGILVVDVDAKNGGLTTWPSLPASADVWTATVATPGGGFHLYFGLDGSRSFRCSAGALGAGIDVRADGGYVVAPCSSTAAGKYVWRDDNGIVPLPDWLAQRLETPRSRTNSNVVTPGSRNAALTRLAGAMRRRGATTETILQALLSHNQTHCVPPLEPEEVQRIAFSIGTYPSNERPNHQIIFHTAAELKRLVPPTAAFVIEGLVAVGAVTEITGPPKRSGKTTLLAHAARSILAGAPFLERATVQTGIVWLTEEGPETFAEALREAGVLESERLWVASWAATKGNPWPNVIEQAVEQCREVDAKFLIIDTLPQFAGLVGDAENNAGDALRAVEPLRAAAHAGLAVLVTRHDRKAGGELGEAGRGSSAFAGAFDTLISLRRREAGRPTLRSLTATSRFRGVVSELVIELTPDGYVSHGSESRVIHNEVMQALLETLPGPPGWTMSEIVSANPKARRSVIQRALQELGSAVSRSGKGKRGDPVRYFVTEKASAQATAPSGGRDQNGRQEEE